MEFPAVPGAEVAVLVAPVVGRTGDCRTGVVVVGLDAVAGAVMVGDGAGAGAVVAGAAVAVSGNGWARSGEEPSASATAIAGPAERARRAGFLIAP